MPTLPPSSTHSQGRYRNLWTRKLSPPPHLDRWTIQPNNIKFSTCSTLAPMWTPPINESAELTQGALYLIYYSEGATPVRVSTLAFGLIGLPLAIFVYSTAEYSHRITAYCTFVRHTHTKLYTEFSKLLCLLRAHKLTKTAPRSHLLVFLSSCSCKGKEDLRIV